MNKNKIFPLKKILLVVLVLAIIYAGYSTYNNMNPVRSELSGIQKVATEYQTKNGNFGIILSPNDLRECFAGNTFVKEPAMNEILTSPEVENISCVFKTASGTPVVEAWSITIVKGERAFCEDSSGDRRETPGLTTSHLCNI